MTQINAYLVFNGNCREAMNFYQSCLGGELLLQTVKESPMANQWPAKVQDNILHARLTKDTIILLGSDMGPKDLVKGNAISLSLTCSDRKEMEECFNHLSVGAQVTHPLHDFFAGTIGTLTDRYSMNWMFYCERSVVEERGRG